MVLVNNMSETVNLWFFTVFFLSSLENQTACFKKLGARFGSLGPNQLAFWKITIRPVPKKVGPWSLGGRNKFLGVGDQGPPPHHFSVKTLSQKLKNHVTLKILKKAQVTIQTNCKNIVKLLGHDFSVRTL